jgi:hypothetical protein
MVVAVVHSSLIHQVHLSLLPVAVVVAQETVVVLCIMVT